MDYQYYKRLFISIVGIYIVYLNYGLVQEKMYEYFFSKLKIAIVIRVLMEVDLNIRHVFYLFSVRLT